MIQQLGFWTQKIQANVDYCYVRRPSALRSALDAIKHPSLRSDSNVAAKRRAEALHVFFFQRSVYSPMIGSHEMRALGALFSLFSMSEPASTDS